MPIPWRGPTQFRLTKPKGQFVRRQSPAIWCRSLLISSQSADSFDQPLSKLAPSTSDASPDATFEVLGSPFSLLSVSLTASQSLFTRRGTLVGVSGNPENVISTLSVLEPFRRAFLRIPFLYQRITSTSPISILISTKPSSTSMATVNLDGTTDWMLAGRALLAWTGQTISIRPSLDRKMSLAHWGNSKVTGRGLLALVGQGSISQVTLQEGESYVVHPGNVVAYSMNPSPPLPYRLKSSSLRLQIPHLTTSALSRHSKFIRTMLETYTWQMLTRIFFAIRTWVKTVIWGDRLFIHFQGPTTILLQTRAPRIGDVLSSQDMNEIADIQPGVVQPAVTLSQDDGPSDPDGRGTAGMPVTIKAPRLSTATIGSDGKVKFEST